MRDAGAQHGETRKKSGSSKDMLKQLRYINECPDMSRAVQAMPKKGGSRICKTLSKDGMISWPNTKRCRRGHKSCRAYKTERDSAGRSEVELDE